VAGPPPTRAWSWIRSAEHCPHPGDIDPNPRRAVKTAYGEPCRQHPPSGQSARGRTERDAMLFLSIFSSSGVTATPWGVDSTATVVITVLSVVSITETLLDNEFVT
jgi:hypothetical protein